MAEAKAAAKRTTTPGAQASPAGVDVSGGHAAAPGGAVVAVQPASGATALAMPADMLAMLAASAKDVAAQERPSVGKISLRAGVMSYGGAPVVGNTMEVLVLASVFRNVFYAGRFDPNNITNPNCFAISVSDKDMAPHENVAEPVSESCAGCPNHEWGSDPNGGRGKACKEGRRLVLVPADCLTDPEAVKTCEMAIMDLPVTSVKNWSNTVNQVATANNLPFWAVVMRVEVRPDPKTQFKVLFSPVRAISDTEVLQAVMARREAAESVGMTPYDETALTNQPAAAPREASKKF
jgi:hypothetical protein